MFFRERFPNEKLGYHSQELRSISLYLFLQFPEKYYLYKFNIVKTFTEKYGFNTIIKGRNENYISYLETANKIKEFVGKYNFASEVKEYKKNPDIYIGHVGDFCEMLRVAVTTLSNTPNLYDILSILGKEEIEKRIKMFEVK